MYFKYRKRPKLFEGIEDIKDPNLADKYVRLQKDVNRKLEEINRINNNIAELRSQIQEIEDQAQENKEQQEEAKEEMQNENLYEQDETEYILPYIEIERAEDEINDKTYQDDFPNDFPNEFISTDDFDDEDVEEDDFDDKEDEDNYKSDEKEYLFYLDILPFDTNTHIYAKVYKPNEDDDWYLSLPEDANDITLENMVFDKKYSKLDIIEYLTNLYEEVDEISESEFLDLNEEK